MSACKSSRIFMLSEYAALNVNFLPAGGGSSVGVRPAIFFNTARSRFCAAAATAALSACTAAAVASCVCAAAFASTAAFASATAISVAAFASSASKDFEGLFAPLFFVFFATGVSPDTSSSSITEVPSRLVNFFLCSSSLATFFSNSTSRADGGLDAFAAAFLSSSSLLSLFSSSFLFLFFSSCTSTWSASPPGPGPTQQSITSMPSSKPLYSSRSCSSSATR
mmetsp:Transcript_44708/g.81768  ORF Transcript_44708/g.81768 Transcript_44708/m.81768 type:complete len:223 (+) Transcript_44708:769-1437(+)